MNAETKRNPGRPRLDDTMVPRILDAAERVFARTDASAITIREIAREADLPHSTIYRYFESKDELLRAVLARGSQRLERFQSEQTQSGASHVLGTTRWFMENNRAYALASMRAALAGQTPSSVGLDADSSAARSLARLREDAEGPHDAGGTDRRVRMAAAVALMMGWTAAEEWIVDATGLEDHDREKLRTAIDDIVIEIVLAGEPTGPSGACD